MPETHKKMTMGLIVGNRGFFPDHLAKTGREEMIRALGQAGMDYVALGPEESKYGAVETHEEAKRCAKLFQDNRHRIDGVIVTLPNFGDERAIADTLRLARLDVPVLVQATPDIPAKMTIAFRRDSFCGKMSACNNLRQYGIPYSITRLHTVAPDSPEFREDLAWFGAVCRVVNGFRALRVGSIGARPTAFNTVRYSEKLLEANGISVETIDLSEILGRIARLADNDDRVQSKLAEIRKYVTTTVRAGSGTDQNVEAGIRDRRLDEVHGREDQRGAVLDLDGGVFRRRALHHHEHDEQQPDSERLRSGYLRHAQHARPGAGFADSERVA